MRGCRSLGLVLVVGFLAGAPAVGWSPRTQIAIGDQAVKIAPPDLRRQLVKHRRELRRGLLAPYESADARFHVKNAAGQGALDQAIRAETERAIEAIRAHRPFSEIVYRLGVVAHFLADLNNPLAVDDADPDEATYYADYLRYVESAQPRFSVVFYGTGRKVERAGDLDGLLTASLERGRLLYPLIGREYDHAGRVAGISDFDDRSTAFGVGSLAFSHAVSDVASVMRYIWIEAGGADQRRLPLSPAAELGTGR